MKTELLLISQVFYPDETATASILTDIAVELAKRTDIKVSVWCGQPSYSTTERQKKTAQYNNISITYMSGTNFQKGNIAGRLLNYLTFSLSLFTKLIFSKDKSPILTVTNPPFLGILIWIIHLINKRPYIYIVHDVQPDGLVKMGIIKESSILAIIWNFFNRLVLKNANKIIVIGRDMVELLNQNIQSAGIKTLFIPNCQDQNIIHPRNFDENPFVINNNLRNKFVVQYSGNMGLWNDMKTLARAAKQLEQSNITFCFIGNGMRKKELLEVWDNNVPSNTLIFPFQPKTKIGESLTACHAALISLREDLEGIAVPSKIYGILAAGIPIIAQVPEKSEIAIIVNEENCGIVINPGDEYGLIKAINFLKNNENKRLLMAENSRKAFEQKYTSSIISEKYFNLLKLIKS